MYFEPDKGNLVHVIDSVELIANKHIVPFQTTVLAPNNQVQQHKDQGSVKGQVKFIEQLEYVPKSVEYESEADEDLDVGYEQPIRAPSMIELKTIVLLKMQKIIYGSMQAAREFWIKLQKAFQAMGYS
jgi:hypothetical protein